MERLTSEALPVYQKYTRGHTACVDTSGVDTTSPLLSVEGIALVLTDVGVPGIPVADYEPCYMVSDA